MARRRSSTDRRRRSARCSIARRWRRSRSAGASATRCTSRPASAAADKSARQTPRCRAEPASRICTSSMASISPTRVRRARLVLDRGRVAWQRRPVRLHPGVTGQDRRLRGRVRPGDRRCGQCDHAQRLQRAARQRFRLLPVRKARERVRPGHDGEWHRQRDRHAVERRRCPGRRAGRAQPVVLLRRHRSAVAANPLHRAGRVCAAEPGQRQPGSSNHRVCRQGHLAGRAGPSSRCLLLRRSGEGRQRAAALPGAPEKRYLRLQRAQQLRRPQPDGAI